MTFDDTNWVTFLDNLNEMDDKEMVFKTIRVLEPVYEAISSMEHGDDRRKAIHAYHECKDLLTTIGELLT